MVKLVGGRDPTPAILRLPEDLLNAIKVLANKEDVPYQSLMKILLAEGVQHRRRSGSDEHVE